MKKRTLSGFALRHATRVVIGLLAVFVALSVVMIFASGHSEWTQALKRLTPLSGVALLVGALANLTIRFLRYPALLRALGLGVPTGKLALYYIAGMAFIPTPGKLGTALRLWLLQQHHSIPLHRSAPLMLLDILTDFLALLLIIAVCLPFLGHPLGIGGGLVLLTGLLMGLVLLFRKPLLLRNTIKSLYMVVGKRKTRLFARLLRLARHVHRLFGWRTLGLTVFFSALAWGIQLVLLAFVLQQLLGVSGSSTVMIHNLIEAVFATTSAILFGGLTFLPGGLGGTEATLIALLGALGVPISIAVAYTVLMRIATLWFSVLLGFIALPFAMHGLDRHKT